jgi:hypothetical protein
MKHIHVELVVHHLVPVMQEALLHVLYSGCGPIIFGICNVLHVLDYPSFWTMVTD